MELILEGTERAPAGGVLSIKIGETRRQAPLSKIGQSFRFSSSPAEALPMKVEVLVPAVRPQSVMPSPLQENFAIDLGGGIKIRMRQRAVEDYQRAVPDVGKIAMSRGVAAEKKEMATTAANYLESHGLVRTFQDLLHGLLVTQPDDPWAYLDESLSRAKALALGGRKNGQRPQPRQKGKGRRGSIESREKVDALMDILKRTRQNLPLILPYLPPEMSDMLVSDELEKECRGQFADLDKDKSGRLGPDALLPLIVQLSTASQQSVGADQCRKFMSLFDANEDGYVSLDEFVSLTQFVIIAAHLETPEGKQLMNEVQAEEARFTDFVDVLIKDRDRINDIVPFLPDYLVQHLTAESFLDDCMNQFDELDADGSNSLSPDELVPVVLNLSKMDANSLTMDKCKQFVSVFDVLGNGVIMRDEFLEFAQFLAVMNFLTSSTEGAQLNAATSQPPKPSAKKEKSAKRGSIDSRSKVDALMDILKRTRQNLPLILPYLPPEMSDMLVSDELEKECRGQFADLDKENTGRLGPDALLPVIVQLSTASHSSVGSDQCRKFISLFDANEDGYINLDEFVSLTQFVIIAAHLETPDGKQLMNEVQAEEARFTDFVDVLLKDKDRINDIVPFLPDYLVQHLTAESFLDDCMNQFDELDVDGSNSLSPDELVPVVLNLSKMDANSITMDKCKQFVSVFDVLGNGVIMRDEFLEFAQFLAVMNFLTSSTEGAQVNEVAMYTAEMRKTDMLIEALEQDVSVLPKVISYLPVTISEELQSDFFKNESIEGFRKLDTNGNNVLDPAELFPVIMKLCEGHPVSIDHEVCKKFTAIFDKDRNGVISINEFVTLCQFVITMGYLQFTKDWREGSVNHSRDKIEALLQLMKDHCDRLDEILPLLPDHMQDDLMSEAFKQECLQYFDELDTDLSGSLEPKELVSVVLDLCKAHPFALTRDQCLRFVDIFDTERTGVLSRSEFVNFARFMMIMSYLETEEGQVVKDFADIATGEKQVEDLLYMLEKDRDAMHKVMPLLPEAVYDALTSDEFVQMCNSRFKELDEDGNGVLSPSELWPLIVELSEAHPYSVDMEQCERFTAIFDVRGDGVIRLDEFLDFARFLEMMTYMNSAAGKQEFAEGLQILQDSMRIEDLISNLEQDRRYIKKVIPYLPEDFRNELLSENFTLTCIERFKDLDADNNGSLDPTELYPVIMDMTSAHHLALDVDQCRRFTSIFDDERTGVISQREFVNFARFLMVMSYLQTEDGQTVLAIALQQEGDSGAASASIPAAPNSPQAVGHLSVDLDYYQQKSDKLARENEDQRMRLLSMEDKMRAMEERMELQERKLRHAAVDLNASR